MDIKQNEQTVDFHKQLFVPPVKKGREKYTEDEKRINKPFVAVQKKTSYQIQTNCLDERRQHDKIDV